MLAALLLAGCQYSDQYLTERDRLLFTGPGIDASPEEVRAYRANQDAVLIEFFALAGVAPLATTPTLAARRPEDWQAVAEAGVNYVDRQCKRYVEALFWADRERNALGKQITLTGAALATILGVVEASAKEIALTAAAFGLAGATVDNAYGSVLYRLEPASVDRLVEELQAAVRADVLDKAQATTRTAAVYLIQRYLDTCLPTTLEAKVNEAVQNSRFVAEPSGFSAVPASAPQTRAGAAAAPQQPAATPLRRTPTAGAPAGLESR
jgi:hypothetical protein